MIRSHMKLRKLCNLWVTHQLRALHNMCHSYNNSLKLISSLCFQRDPYFKLFGIFRWRCLPYWHHCSSYSWMLRRSLSKIVVVTLIISFHCHNQKMRRTIATVTYARELYFVQTLLELMCLFYLAKSLPNILCLWLLRWLCWDDTCNQAIR